MTTKMKDAEWLMASPEGYNRDAEAAGVAALAWLKAHPCAQLAFFDIEADQARKAGLPAGTRVAVVADLEDAIPLWACNDDARALLHAMHEATGRRATYLMAKIVLEQIGLVKIVGEA